MAHYIHDEKNNRIEGMSKEEIYALLAEAIQEGELPSVDEDTAFVTMIKSIVDGKPYKIGFCTQAQYNALEAQGLLVADALYYITDDETYDDLIDYIDQQVSEIENTVAGFDARITTNTNNITTNTNNITTNTNNITTNTTDILNIKNNGALYRHVIRISSSSNVDLFVTIYSKQANQMTINDFISYIEHTTSITGYYYITTWNSVYSIYYDSSFQRIILGLVGETTVAYISKNDFLNYSFLDYVTKIFDLAVDIANPTYTAEFDYEDSGFDYNKVLVTNPNTAAGTLYYRTGTSGSYTSVAIGANATVNIGTYISYASGDMYLDINGTISNVVSWSAS